MLVTGGYDKQVCLWDVDNMIQKFRLQVDDIGFTESQWNSILALDPRELFFKENPSSIIFLDIAVLLKYSLELKNKLNILTTIPNSSWKLASTFRDITTGWKMFV
jgi:hypothetical protein